MALDNKTKRYQNNGSISDDLKPTETDSDYYNNLRQESYRAMLNSEIQANAAKNQALKYTQNAMAAQGLGTQGVSESTKVGIINNYQNANANAVSKYREALLGINQDERKEQLAEYEANGKDLYNDLYDRLQIDENGKITGADTEAMKELIKTYGGTFDEETGKPNLENAKLTENQKKAITNMYETVLKAGSTGDSGSGEKATTNNPLPYQLDLLSDEEKTSFNNKTLRFAETDSNTVSKEKGYQNYVVKTSKDEEGNDVNTKILANFYEGSGLNKDIIIKVGDKEYHVEMSNKIGTRYNGDTAQTYDYYKSQYSYMPIGIPFQIETKSGDYWLCIKDQYGDIRRLEKYENNNSNNSYELNDLAEALGYNKNNVRTRNVK